MKWFKRIFVFALLLITVVLAHYYLPQRDIVKIVDTDVKRMDIRAGSPFWDSPDVGTNDEATRDVRFISTVRANGKTSVYRNEDTGWSFPFYMKFDSSDLSAKAQNLSRNDDQWVAVTHYGWRIRLFSIWPNATKVKPVSGPDTFLIPWFNIAFFLLLAFIVLMVWRWMRKLKRRHVDPVASKIEKAADDVREDVEREAKEAGGAISRVFRKFFGSSTPR